MFKFLQNLLDDNAKDIKKYSAVVEKINALEPQMQALSDEALKAKTPEFKARLKQGETENDILPEAFAVVREASRRVLGMRHFDVQLMGGMALHDGRIAEMKTGEGKTLVATAPVYLNALSGKGVHVVTVNDYLATRDSEWMGRVYHFLGLSVGLIVHDMKSEEKKAAYAADITYGTNNEFGFDYLRDNMAVSPDWLFQRGLHYAIVDEVDSILIDEARTPLIISGPSDKPTELYYRIAELIPRLKNEEDYTVDEKARTAALTEAGVAKMEKLLNVENLYEQENTELAHYVNQGLKAYTLFKRDRDYVVKEGQVIIVDEFTGRLMFGRRYSEGIHQSIEAKERVKIERESQTLATVTFQNYFRMYEKLAGMTGTAATEENEFREIYKLDVVQIPTNLPMQREDAPDSIYRTQAGKLAAVIADIEEEHKKGRPVLVGTVSIEKSEQLSEMLKRRGIKHQVLNAKFHEKEAQIVAQAGREGAVTIATNMAGRGTDILLGGSYEMMAEQEMQANPEHEYSDAERLALLEKYKQQTKDEHERVVRAGGLHIIGTERHDSRRIDNQLRGRAGRQGDPGSSRFYLSMEDDLMRLFGGDNLGGMMDRIGMDDSMPIASPIVSRSMEAAQKRVESRNFDMRKNTLDYDNVMNEQREVIYGQRRRALFGENLSSSVKGMLEDVVERNVANYAISPYPEEWDMNSLLSDLDIIVPDRPSAEELKALDKSEIAPLLIDRAYGYLQKREAELGFDIMRQMERWAILRAVDNKWMAHLDAMDQMRQGIGLRAYGQRDPLVEYKYEAYEMFNQMNAEIQEAVIKQLMIAKVELRVEEKPRQMVENRSSDGTAPAKKPVRRDAKQVGRNDPCPCGSGLKYKKCCGKDA